MLLKFFDNWAPATDDLIYRAIRQHVELPDQDARKPLLLNKEAQHKHTELHLLTGRLGT